MKLLKANEEIVLSGEEAINIMAEIEYLLISLRDIARHYYDNVDGEISTENRALYCEETTKFIDDNQVTKRLARIRRALTDKFTLELGCDNMDDIERAMENIAYWKPKQK